MMLSMATVCAAGLISLALVKASVDEASRSKLVRVPAKARLTPRVAVALAAFAVAMLGSALVQTFA